MQKLLWAFLLGFAVILPLRAELSYQGEYNPDTPLQEYFQEAYPNENKSIIYVFYNDTNMTCENCPQTISLIEQVYDNNYQNDYNLFVIDYGNDDEYNFISTYQLSKPLEIVLVRINDGAEFGYKKLEGLNYRISDPLNFADELKFQIDSFLGE